MRAAEGRLDVRSLLLSRLRAFAVNSCSCVAPPSPCPSLIEVQGSRFSVRCPTINSPNYQPRQRQPHGLAVPNRDRRHERPALFRDSKLSCYPFPSGPNYLQAEHDDAHDDDEAVRLPEPPAQHLQHALSGLAITISAIRTTTPTSASAPRWRTTATGCTTTTRWARSSPGTSIGRTKRRWPASSSTTPSTPSATGRRPKPAATRTGPTCGRPPTRANTLNQYTNRDVPGAPT